MADQATYDPDAAVSAFEGLVDRPDVSVSGDTAELVEEFGRLVERYESIEPELRELQSALPGDGDGIPVAAFVADETIEQWRGRNPEVVTEIQRLFEDYQRIFERVDPEGDAADETSGDDAVGALMDRLVVWKTIVQSPDE